MEEHTQASSSSSWNKNPGDKHPYKLIAKTRSQEGSNCTNSFQAVAMFPWTKHHLSQLWNGKFEHRQDQWNLLIDKWNGAVAVGGGRKLRIFISRPHWEEPFMSLFAVELPDENASIRAITWCLVEKDPKTGLDFVPLLAFAGDAILYVLNVNTRTFHGVLRGHGGKITSLAVHPLDPSTLCSTSFDHTTRIYDLEKELPVRPVNPTWPGWNKQSLAGPAFGQRGKDGEGIGHGLWVAVLAGGPSGGHQDAVLCAAFHRSFPIIATCGADHCVKLWHTPKLDGHFVSREDKPLFSSSFVHSAPVRSITWMNQDTLLTHSDPIILRNPDKSLRNAPGTLVLWRWLGLDRFFPPDRNTWPEVMRGCASDYQESASFKVITEYKMPPPISATQIHVHQSIHSAPLILMPSKGGIRISSTLYFRPRKPPPFPDECEQMTREVENMSLSGHEAPAREENIVNWVVETGDDDVQVVACAFDEGGDLLVGVGEKESIWLWRRHG